MPSLFPGMNPYLEHPDRWSTVHNRLMVAIADVLTPQLLPKYQVDIEKRIYQIVPPDSLMIGRADVSVQESRATQPNPNVTSTALLTQPVRVNLPELEEMRETFLEVKEAATQKVVTIIEVLSPSNKRGQGREKYLAKRQKVLASQTNLVEIDLLREGEALPLGTSSPSQYRILCSRATDRPIADLYPFNLPDPIPLFPLPLQVNDREPIVDLKQLLDEVYERSGYAYFIDYGAEVKPGLSEADRAWVEVYLQQQGLI
jgi:hypothetical protein